MVKYGKIYTYKGKEGMEIMKTIKLTEQEYWKLLEGEKSFNKSRIDFTICEVHQLIGYTGLEEEKVIAYVFGKYEVEWIKY